jgi:hypothetical protein
MAQLTSTYLSLICNRSHTIFNFCICLESIVKVADSSPKYWKINCYYLVYVTSKLNQNSTLYFAVFHSVHFPILGTSSIVPTKFTLFIHYISTPCFGISHAIFRDNLRVPYSKTPACMRLLCMVQWLLHKI